MSSKEMLDWQYKWLLAELGLLQDHAADSTCPCRLKDLGEWCIPKHALKIMGYASETASMDPANADLLFELQDDANRVHQLTRQHVCSRGPEEDIVSWARDWRKQIEPIYYSCSLPMVVLEEPQKAIEIYERSRSYVLQVAGFISATAGQVTDAVMGEVKVRISGSCKKDNCTIKVKGSDSIEASTSAIGDLPEIIQEVSETLESKKAASDKTFAIGVSGKTRYEFRYRLADMSDLIFSHDPFSFAPNPDYPQELQPRLRDRAATRVQVETMSRNIDPDSLLTDFQSLDRGAPIVGPDNIVESGNGRIMALYLAASQEQPGYARYVASLKTVAPRYKLNTKAIDKLLIPVLIRERITKVDRKQFVEEANAASTIESSSIEKARTDADKISLPMIQNLSMTESESIEDALRSSRNKGFVTSFLSRLPDNEQAKLIDSDGRISQDGVRRITMALFVATFNDETGLRLAESFFESTDVNVRNVLNGILQSLGPLAQAESLSQSGQRIESYTVGLDLGLAIEVFSKIKKTPGQSVEKYLNQGQMFERELSPFQERVLFVLDENSRSGKRIAGILREYARLVIDSAPPDQASMIESVRPSKEDLFERAVAGRQQEMFEPSPIIGIYSISHEITSALAAAGQVE